MRPRLWSAPLGAVLLLTGCEVRTEPSVSESRSIELGEATSARLDIEMSAGELRVDPGSVSLLAGDFRFAGPKFRPELKYDISNGRGYLALRQPPLRLAGNFGENRWDLRISDRVPMDLKVKLGAGQSKLRLAGLTLRRLEVEIGAGELDLDLNGRWAADVEGSIRGGVGSATVRLPSDVGVRVKASGGIGSVSARNLRRYQGYYVNEKYGHSETQLRLEVTGGIGEINLVGND